jgi:fructokinase
VIVVAGEALIDLLPVPASGGRRYDARPGGAPCNVAAGLARLGRRTCFLGRLSTDAFGGLLRQHLAAAGADLSMAVTAAQPTTLGVASLDPGGRAEYTFYAEGTANWQWTEAELPQRLPAGTLALYTGGLAARLPPGAPLLEELMRRTRQQDQALVFYDPNVRSGFGFSMEAERARVERQISAAHVVKASKDDIGLLYPGSDDGDIAASWRRLTGGLVVVTLDADGAYALLPDGTRLTVPAAPTERVVDTVGAGDAFASALLDGLAGAVAPGGSAAGGLASLAPGTASQLLERASVSAAWTCARAGAESADAATLADALRRARRGLASPPGGAGS